MTNVTKIYELRTLGFADIHKDLQSIAKDFDAIKKAKREAEQSFAKATAAGNTEEARKFTEQMHKLRLEEAELRKQRQQMLNDQKAEQIARQQNINQQREQKKSADALAGSYAETYKQYRELYNLVKNTPKGSPVTFQGQTLQFDEAITKLKALATAEQDFRRQFSRDSLLVGEYTSGIVQAFKQMGLDDLVGGQVTKANDRLQNLNSTFEKLKIELQQARQTGVGSLESIEKKLIQNRQEALRLNQEVGRLSNELRGTGDIGSQITESLSKGFEQAKGQVLQLVLGYVGVQKILESLQNSVSNAAVISDQETDLEIQLKGTSKEVDNLNNSLKTFDTRTTVQGLQEIADTALKAGAAKENIASVTQAIDKTKIAFGKDFGSVEEGTETMAKLINIFYDDGEITGERILGIGNSVRTLANETVASVPFINDFAGRMAGLRQIANITLPDVIGLGAGFEEFKQSAEVSSSALVKVIPALAKDVEKFAKIAGTPIEEFKKLLNENPVEALLKVSEGLVKGKGDIEGVAKAFSDAGLDAGRVTTILATLGGKADIFRDRIRLAGSAMNDNSAITEAFEKKNNNLAATFDKINKKFADVAANKAFQGALIALTSIVVFLLTNLPLLLTLLTLTGIGWATLTKEVVLNGVATEVTNGKLLLQRATLIGNNILLGLTRIYTLAATIAQTSYNAVLALYTGVVNRATVATVLFGNATKLAGIGALIAIIAILLASFRALGAEINGSTEALRKQARQQQILNEISQKANLAVAEQISKIDGFVAVVKNAAASIDTKRDSLQKLIDLDPSFRQVLDGQTINLQKLKEVYDKVTESIRAKARAEAAASLSAEKQKDVLAVSATRQRLETEFARGRGAVRTIKGLSSEDIDRILSDLDLSKVSVRSTGNGGIQFFEQDFARIKGNLKRQEDAAISIYDDYVQAQATTQAQLSDIERKSQEAAKKNAALASKQFEIDIPFLKKQIEDLDNQIKDFRGAQKDLDGLINKRKDLQAKLDSAMNKEHKVKAYGGAKLSGQQKDAFKDIDASRDTELADAKRLFESKYLTEEEYLKDVLSVNQKAIDDKLKLIKGKNAEERKVIAELHLERITQEKETNDKIFALRETAYKEQFDRTVANAKEATKNVESDPKATATDKAQAKLDEDKKILDAQVLFNSQMDNLEKDLNRLSKKNAEDRARDRRTIMATTTEDERRLFTARIEDVKKTGENLQAEFELVIDKAIAAAQSDKNLSASQTQAKIRGLEYQRQYGILVRQGATYKVLAEDFKKAYEAGVVTLAEYEAIVKKLGELQNQIAEGPKKDKPQSIGQRVQSKISDAFGFTSGSEEDRLVGEALAQTYALAQDAMHSYFDQERQRIQDSLALSEQRIDIEKKQLLNRAQSKAEEESLDRQAEAKKREARTKAGEELKKSKKAEARIALATELANIWATVYQLGPIAGPILGGALSLLALGRYSLRVNEINKEKFEFGGMPGRGGRIGGRSHSQGGTPFGFKGKHYEAEVDELAVIRTRNASKNKLMNVVGTQSQIASAINVAGGGVNFEPGASVRTFDYGGNLGSSLSAPVFTPSSVIAAYMDTSEIVSEVREMRRETARMADETSKRIDRLEVYQVTGTVTEAQKKQAKQSEIGTL